MAAPIGNQFWKNAALPGRKRIFKTPEELWKEAQGYFEWCDAHPLLTEEIYGKDPERFQMNRVRAYTWSGLELFLGVESLREYRTTYKEFSPIISHIEKIIWTHKFENAAANLLNPNIIARELGLIDKMEITKQKFTVKRK